MRRPRPADHYVRSRIGQRVLVAVLSLIVSGGFPASLLDANAADKATEITGKARVTSGDTIEIAGERIRLGGIDAPELDQQCRFTDGAPYPCGMEAMRRLAKLVSGHEVRCSGGSRDRRDYLIALCAVGPLDLNELMVASGWALADREHGKEYLRAEGAAKARREGMWRFRDVEARPPSHR